GLAAVAAHAAVDAAYQADIAAWRAKVEKSLRSDNGWLTLAGRYELSAGANTIGSGSDNQIVMAPGLAPERLGTILIEDDKVTLKLAPEVEMFNARGDPIGFSERTLATDLDRRDWVYLGRLSFHVIKRDEGKYILRVSDRDSDTRKNFVGRIWYDVKPAMRVKAKFVPYHGKKIDIVNVLGEVAQEPVAGYLEFKLNGKTRRLDALADPGEPLFVIFGDRSGETATYPPGRFLQVAVARNGRTVIDFNKAYNPPCAFSAFTTCPLPPPQNILKTSVAAGEKFRSH
ncbi:MAG: DUF1684 domain-containing protein, partial [Acidobacteriota bacterium]